VSETINLARLKKGSENFEVVVDPEKAMQAKKGKLHVQDALIYPEIFSDAKKGMKASEQKMEALFETSDPLEVAGIIIKQGTIQLTSEYRAKLLEQKKARVVSIIQRNGIDPKTGAPHPLTRIENAIAEAKVKIDEFLPAEQQVDDVLKKLQPIIPIKFVTKQIEVTIPAEHAGRAFNTVKQMGKIIKEQWLNDGSWNGVVELPGGMEQDFYDKLNAVTKGSSQAKTIKVM